MLLKELFKQKTITDYELIIYNEIGDKVYQDVPNFRFINNHFEYYGLFTSAERHEMTEFIKSILNCEIDYYRDRESKQLFIDLLEV